MRKKAVQGFKDSEKLRIQFMLNNMNANKAYIKTSYDIKKIREIEIVLGNKNKNIQKSEKENYKYLRRSAAAITDLSAKTRIKKSHITGIRPLTGIPIEETNRIIGKKLRKKLKKGQIIKKSNLE